LKKRSRAFFVEGNKTGDGSAVRGNSA